MAKTIYKVLTAAFAVLVLVTLGGIGRWHALKDLDRAGVALPDKYYPRDTPFEKLDCEAAFKGLKPEERRYAHYLSRASWDGQFITFFQTSPESPLIFIVLDKVLRIKPTIFEVKVYLKETHGYTDDDVIALFVYAGAFFANGGNYRGFGDTKFVPEVSREKLESLVKDVSREEADFFIEHCLEPMIDYGSLVRSLGFPSDGITTYWSANCNDSDMAKVADYLKEKNLDAYNHRVFKKIENGKTSYEIRFASEQLSTDPDTTAEKLLNKVEVRNGVQFKATRGDYSNIMPAIIKNLDLAEKNAANDHERQMLKKYVEYFRTGSLQSHKDGSRHWIKDKGPAVESYIGFIETYRDPAGARGEFQGFVAVVNRLGSKKLGKLVDEAEKIIKAMMPWPGQFEKDSYLRPDFTALDIIAFSGSGVPSGINIPNYDEIRQNEGFKNVHLQNVVMAQSATVKINFVSESDAVLIKKYREAAFEVQLGLHELLGHGSGKLFQRADGKLNFDPATVNPITGKPVSSFYTEGQSYDSVFNTLGSSYEECRAEAVGMYLCLQRSILEIFNHHEQQEQDDVLYVNWLTMVLSGLKGLEAYNVDSQKWGQAHSRARYVILRVLLEQAPGLVTIKEVTNPDDQKPDLLVTLIRDQIHTSGKKSIHDFLVKLQVYKSTADITEAEKMFSAYSKVDPDSEFRRWRDIAVTRKIPRTVLVQSNTRLNSSTKDVDLLTYPSTPEGFAQSWVDRYDEPESIYDSLRALYFKDLKYFPIHKN